MGLLKDDCSIYKKHLRKGDRIEYKGIAHRGYPVKYSENTLTSRQGRIKK
ncbi:hypothetical protein J14TS2_27420 [Bacillus sp. J14TS2]|nr:hypothetical protein J14TS2_27420 [Bacillus sp. J14TS2]